VSYVAVPARIRRDLYEKPKKCNIVVSDVVRRALEEVARRGGGRSDTAITLQYV